VGWRFCEPADPQAKGAVERLQGYAETNFEPGRAFANELDFPDQLDAWFERVNARRHKTLRDRPVDRLRGELEAMEPLPAAMPDTARRWAMRVPPDPHLKRACAARLADTLGVRPLEAPRGWLFRCSIGQESSLRRRSGEPRRCGWVAFRTGPVA
jgi:hypothetical protein